LIQSYQAFFCLADRVFFPLCQKSIKIIFFSIVRLNVKNGRKQKNLNYNLTITLLFARYTYNLHYYRKRWFFALIVL
jgi:hypothetical protein